MHSTLRGAGDAILRIQSNDDEMHHATFGRPQSEEACLLIFARKASVPSMEEFLTRALALADSRDGTAEWTETYRDLDHTPAEPIDSWRLTGLRRWTEATGYEKETVTLVIKPILNCTDLGPQGWNDRTSVIETETDYIFYSWYTSA